ncbi:beta strand repeat-containing protein [Sandaracinus amylolyticus]|uniref:Fibronectin type III domain protein n=1 Tax=Sandaracinus amylolyticus TaxID=927083 RepID=A0A0F6SFX7_9BACT|nr:putative Ig domain-containing protein [Sandaracinus amylolyticus]AKF07714.1 Fibronectin type III domain protein [Sandaracinus amylolyticus]
MRSTSRSTPILVLAALAALPPFAAGCGGDDGSIDDAGVVDASAADASGADASRHDAASVPDDGAIPDDDAGDLDAQVDTTLAVDDAFEIAIGAAHTVDAPGVLANDTIAGATITAFDATSRLGGVVALSADGSFVYTPPSITDTPPIDDDFTYTLGTTAATVTLTLVDVPVATDDRYGTLPDTALTIDAPGVLANDAPNGARIDAFDTTSTQGGTVALAPDGGLVFTPATGFQGDDTFTYRLANVAGMVTATVTIDVSARPTAVDDLAYAVARGATLVADGTTHPTLLANDALGAPLAVITSFGARSLGGDVTDHAAGSTATVAGSSVTVEADGTLTFAPAPAFVGPFELEYQLANATGTSIGVVRIDVRDAPLATDDAFTVRAGETLEIPASDPTSLLADDVGAPAPELVSFGGGSLGGSDTDHAAGATVTVGSDAITVRADGSLTFVAGASSGGEVTFDYVIANAEGEDRGTVRVTVERAPAITSGSSLTLRAGDSSGLPFAFVATGHPTPSITVEGTLPSGVTFDTATSSLVGAPSATSGGAYSFTVRARNGVAPEATQTFSLTVEQAPVITGAATATFRVGQAQSYSFSMSGYPAPTAMLSNVLPIGLVFDATARTISGTPAEGSAGTYPVSIIASNGVGPDVALDVTIDVRESPVIGSPDATTFTVGTPGSFAVAVIGTPRPTVSIAGALPTGVVFDPATRTLGGTPAPGTGGTYALTFTASNGVGTVATQSFTLTIREAPALSGAATATFTVGTNGTYAFTGAGYPIPTLALTGSLPSGLALDAAARRIQGTPAAGTGGTYPVTVTATNGVGADATLSVTVTVRQPPAITSASATTFTVGTAGTFTATATGFPAPTVALAGTLPTGVVYDAATRTLSGTPAAGTGGTYPLTFTASDGLGNVAAQSFTLTVNEAASIAGTPPGSLTVGTAYSHTFTVSGHPAPTLAVISGTLPPGLALDSATRRISGTPTTAGTYANVVVRAQNGVGTAATITFSMTVVAPVSPPTVTNDAYGVTGNVPIDVPLAGSVLANDTLNGATITGYGPSSVAASTTAVGAPLTTMLGGRVVLQSDGTFVYEPPAGAIANDAFAYTITNAAASVVATVSLGIQNRVWFVDASAAAGGSGTRVRPVRNFGELPATSSGDVVHVAGSGAAYSAYTLGAGVRLLGQGIAVTTAHLGFAPATYARAFPAVSAVAPRMGTLTLGTSVYVRGIDVVVSSSSRGLVASGASGVDVALVSVTASGAEAVHLTNVGGTIALRAVSATGGPNGIVVTNNTGSFSIVGDGTGANNGSGGTIQSTTSDGVLLTNARNVTLRSLAIANAPTASGVRGVVVDGITLEGMRVTGTATALDFDDATVASPTMLSGAVVVRGCELRNASTSALAIVNAAGTISSLTFEGNTVSNVTFTAVRVELLGTARADDVVVRANTMTTVGTDLGANGLTIALGDDLDPAIEMPYARVVIENNSISGTSGYAVWLRSVEVDGTLALVLRDNTLTMPSSGVAGVRVQSGTAASGLSTVCAQMSGNRGGTGFSLRLEAGDRFGIVGLGSTTPSSVVSYVQSQNPLGGTVALSGATSNFTSCVAP